MARAGLDKNRKFLRLAQALNAFASGMGDVLARGVLETLWSAAYERADDHLGDLDDVELAAKWRGTAGTLATALLCAGGDGFGFIEPDNDRGGYKIHDLWDHAPPWVKRKSDAEAARRAAGKTIADVRRDAGRLGAAKPKADGETQTVDRMRASGQQAVSKRSTVEAQKPALGRVGRGKGIKSLAAVKPAAHAGGEHDGDGTTDGADGSDDDTPRADALDGDATRSTAPLKLVATDAPTPDRITRGDALARIAAASGGRFVASPPKTGGTMALDRVRKAHPDGAVFDLVGRALAAGLDAFKGKLDGRAVADLEAWVAQAKAWDGVSPFAATARPPPATAAPANRPPPSSSWSPK